MIVVSEYFGQKVGVFGLGKAGAAAVASLQAGGAEVFVGDDTMLATSFKDWPWHELKALVLSPGVPFTHPAPHPVVLCALEAGVPVIGDLELLYRAQQDATFIGITGTNGKSTTTTLIGHILQEAGLKPQVGGNLGTAALSLEPLGKGGVYVIEASSYQLDLLQTARFNVAILLNITPDHLDRHGDMEGYVAAKMHIFEHQQVGDSAIVAVDDAYTKEIVREVSMRGITQVVRVSAAHQSAEIYVKDAVLYDGAYCFDLRAISTLIGQHNWQNAAAAYAVARVCGVASTVIYEAMKSFAGLRHRLQLVITIRGVRFINDSKATNADATANALAPYKAIYWIAGGKPKAGGIASLAPYFTHVAHAFLIGEAEADFSATLEGKVTYTRCGTLAIAVQKAAALAFAENKKDAVVLLSPACASFDQFKSFEHRGDVFCELVENVNAA